MKTKYILHGGMCKEKSDWNKHYYQEMVKGLLAPKVLLVYFAREKEEYEYLTQRDKGHFAWANPGLRIDFTVASEDKFVDQVKASNVVFFCGGETQKLIDTVKKHKVDYKKLFEGKIISGSSAGSYLISTWYYGNSRAAIFKGLGLLPVAVMAHYCPKKGTEFWLPEEKVKLVEKSLQEKAGKAELIKIPEQQFVVYE